MATSSSAARSEFADHCVELLGALGKARARRMFGGHGLYLDDLFMALVTHEQLYLKVDAQTEAAFKAAGCKPFVYESSGKPVQLNYWTAPEAALESPAELRPWARLAVDAALRARAAKPARKAARQASPNAAREPTKKAARKTAPKSTHSSAQPSAHQPARPSAQKPKPAAKVTAKAQAQQLKPSPRAGAKAASATRKRAAPPKR